MQKSSRLFILLRLLLGAGALFIAADTCHKSPVTASHTVEVYADVNANGERDPGEAGIPEALVVINYNHYGAMNNLPGYTSADGTLAFTATYTNFLNILVVPPCGYHSTTPIYFDNQMKDVIQAGFAPDAPRPGRAIVNFTAWEDANRNDLRDPGEQPKSGLTINIGLGGVGGVADGTVFLLQTSDENGTVSFDLGNSCGTLGVNTDYDWKITAANEEYWLLVPYDLGGTSVDLGIYPAPTSTPYPTRAVTPTP